MIALRSACSFNGLDNTISNMLNSVSFYDVWSMAETPINVAGKYFSLTIAYLIFLTDSIPSIYGIRMSDITNAYGFVESGWFYFINSSSESFPLKTSFTSNVKSPDFFSIIFKIDMPKTSSSAISTESSSYMVTPALPVEASISFSALGYF